MSDDLVERLSRLAYNAETANHWTDAERLMPASGVADIVYEALDRVQTTEAKLAKAVEFAEGTVRYAGNSGDDYLAEIARTILAEMKGQDDE